MSSVARPQDLPPVGGFSKIIYERTPHKSFFNGTRIALFTIASYALGIAIYLDNSKHERKKRIEQLSGQNAIQPFLVAERDRQLMMQMRRNRDAEARLMKDHPGWEVGTLYGNPVYNTVGRNEWIGYHSMSYYAHADPDLVEEYEHWSETF